MLQENITELWDTGIETTQNESQRQSSSDSNEKRVANQSCYLPDRCVISIPEEKKEKGVWE